MSARERADQAAAAYGIGYLWRDPKTGVEHALNPVDVTIVTRGEPDGGDLFARMDERRKVAEEIRAALIERSQDWPKETGEWREGWRGGLVDGADTAAVHGLPPEFREAYETAFDQAAFGSGDGVPRGILSMLPVHDARVGTAPKDRLNRHFLPLFGAAAEGLEFADEDRPRQGSEPRISPLGLVVEPPLLAKKIETVPWGEVQLTVKVGAGIPDGIIRNDSNEAVGVGVWGYPHPVGKAACEACGKLLLYNLTVGVILHVDPADGATCTKPYPGARWAQQSHDAKPTRFYPTPSTEPHIGSFRQQLADAEAADPERFRILRIGTWRPEELA